MKLLSTILDGVYDGASGRLVYKKHMRWISCLFIFLTLMTNKTNFNYVIILKYNSIYKLINNIHISCTCKPHATVQWKVCLRLCGVPVSIRHSSVRGDNKARVDSSWTRIVHKPEHFLALQQLQELGRVPRGPFTTLCCCHCRKHDHVQWNTGTL